MTRLRMSDTAAYGHTSLQRMRLTTKETDR
jgi:hypothetical protein